MQDDRADNATSNHNSNIDTEQNFVVSIHKKWHFMYYRLGKAFKSCMEKINDIARSRHNQQPYVTLSVPSFQERRKYHYSSYAKIRQELYNLPPRISMTFILSATMKHPITLHEGILLTKEIFCFQSRQATPNIKNTNIF